MPNSTYLDMLSVPDPGILSSYRHSSSNSASWHGFPLPDEQASSPAVAITKYYFADEAKWHGILGHGDFDDVVIGTGFCAFAYIDKALRLNPKRRILVLERGDVWLMSHFQNLPLPFNLLLNNASETYPWGLSPLTFHSDIKFVRGCVPFFGGRSPFSSAWASRPPLGSMRDFPKSLLAAAGDEQFWKGSRDLLNVVEPDGLYGGDYQALQKYTGERLNRVVSTDSAERKINTASYAEPANFAVGKTTGVSKLAFEKFSTPGPLLRLYERQRKLAKNGEGSPLTITTNVIVERFEIDPLDPGQRAHVLHTSRGVLSFSSPKKPNIILATGAIPACTIVLNSVAKQRGRAGSRLGGHFLGHINARFPLPGRFRSLRKEEWDERRRQGRGVEQRSDDALQIGAYYLAGRDPTTGLQYHGEITVVHLPLAEVQQEDAARLCPDFFSAPIEAQLEGSQDHVIVACIMRGEIDEANPECRIRFNEGRSNKATNVDLQLTLSERSKKLRDVMYKAALQAIDAIAGEKTVDTEYWHDNGDGAGRWDKSEPDKTQFQVQGAVDVSSTLYMDDSLPLHPNLEAEVESRSLSQPSVDRNYRVYGTGNVYATGSAIFPTSGSWNPTLAMCGFAQDLAIRLHRFSVFRQVFSLSIASDRMHHFTGNAENLHNAVRGRVYDALASLNPKGPSSQRGIWQLHWGPVVWKHDSDVTITGPDLSWYVAYHDNLEFEDGSLHPTFVIAITGAPGTFVNKVVDFNAYVSDGQFKTHPTEAYTNTLDAGTPYITLSTAKAVHTLLTNPAPSVVGVRTLLSFINGVKSTKDPRAIPRFIFTGHGVGGAIAPSLALALVSGGVIPADCTLTYSTAAPSPGNAAFADLFERTFRPRTMSGVDAYKSWNINLVNTLDVVPQAWCNYRHVSPSQNLSNIPTIYGTPIVFDTIRITDMLIARASDSGVVFKPLPSRYFTGTPPSVPPANLDAFLQTAVQQHVQAYLREVGIDVLGSDFSQDERGVKTEADIRLSYPVIGDFERSRDRAGTHPAASIAITTGTGIGTGTGGWIWVGPGAPGAGIETWRIGTGTGIGTGSEVGIKSPVTAMSPGSGIGTGSGTSSPTRTEIRAGSGAGPGTETGIGTIAVTPLSSLTVLKYGDPEHSLIPQSVQNHPVLVYRSCFPGSVSASEIKSYLSSVGVVEPHRTGTLLIKDHFYLIHKVVYIAVGQAQLRFGGESNPSRVDVEVKKGDVVVIPAGVPHRLLKDVGRDLSVVESYLKGVNVDSDSRRLGSRPQQSHLFSIASLAWFSKDPVYGDQGPVLGC